MEINTFTSISITFPLHNQIFHQSSCQLYDYDADYGDHNRCDDGDDDCVCDYAAYRPVMSQMQFFKCSTPTVCVEFAFWGRGRGARTSLKLFEIDGGIQCVFTSWEEFALEHN